MVKGPKVRFEIEVDDCREVFERELSKIHDVTIKDFVIEVFNTLCPDYFWRFCV